MKRLFLRHASDEPTKIDFHGKFEQKQRKPKMMFDLGKIMQRAASSWIKIQQSYMERQPEISLVS